MRIVIDLQAAQSSSRFRGIGRYALSLVEAMIRLNTKHEIILALSGLFPNTIEPIQSHFEHLLPKTAIRVWHTPSPVSECHPENHWRQHASEYIREAFLAELKPDIVLLSSLFEGYSDNSVTSIAQFDKHTPTAIILYDLIPLLHPNHYLASPEISKWYHQKTTYIQQAALVLAISASAKEEVLSTKLTAPGTPVTNISGASTDYFKKINIPDDLAHKTRARYQLTQPFLMYTGGIDYRKNIEGLIRGYATLPLAIRQQHQLAIVCAIQPPDKGRLTMLAKQHGLQPNEVIFTDFVSDLDLLTLYNLCKAFVFPSWHEGFGLPILEAMQCEAPVIGSNCSSIPEVIGNSDALFNPHDDSDIAHKIEQALTNESYRQALITHSIEQARTFSWQKTAQSVISAMEEYLLNRAKTTIKPKTKRLKLAYVSPMPPEQSGIATYSAMLLPALANHYTIDVIVKNPSLSDPSIKQHASIRSVSWFLEHASAYDRVLYQMGNSTYHDHMFDLIQHIPGVMVLHDFYLSGILAYLETSCRQSHAWSSALYYSHGYQALAARYQHPNLDDVRREYPCNRAMVESSLGCIVHSKEGIRLAQHWLNLSEPMASFYQIPLLHPLPNHHDKHTFRTQLDLGEHQFIICSFGFLASTKLNMELLKTWLVSGLAKNPNCMLIFVGETSGDYGQEIHAFIQKHQLSTQVRITGWVDDATFNQYLSSADLSVQLRAASHGETSAAVLACLAYGIPTIVSAHGSLAELPSDAVWMLSEPFQQNNLSETLNTLCTDAKKRDQLSKRAQAYIQEHHTASACAGAYFNAIEASYAHPRHPTKDLIRAISKIKPTPSHSDQIGLAHAIILNQRPTHGIKQLFICLSPWRLGNESTKKEKALLQVLLDNPPYGYRIEPIYTTRFSKGFRYARKRMLRWLGCPRRILRDDPILARPGDCFLTMTDTLQESMLPFIQELKHRGIFLYLATESLDKSPEQEGPIDAYLMAYLPKLHWRQAIANHSC